MKSISDEMHEQDQSAETVLILRTCNADMTSHRGFIWPEAGPVEDPDWKQTPNCRPHPQFRVCFQSGSSTGPASRPLNPLCEVMSALHVRRMSTVSADWSCSCISSLIDFIAHPHSGQIASIKSFISARLLRAHTWPACVT